MYFIDILWILHLVPYCSTLDPRTALYIALKFGINEFDNSINNGVCRCSQVERIGPFL